MSVWHNGTSNTCTLPQEMVLSSRLMYSNGKSSERALCGRKSSSKPNASVTSLLLRITAIWPLVMFLEIHHDLVVESCFVSRGFLFNISSNRASQGDHQVFYVKCSMFLYGRAWRLPHIS